MLARTSMALAAFLMLLLSAHTAGADYFANLEIANYTTHLLNRGYSTDEVEAVDTAAFLMATRDACKNTPSFEHRAYTTVGLVAQVSGMTIRKLLELSDPIRPHKLKLLHEHTNLKATCRKLFASMKL